MRKRVVNEVPKWLNPYIKLEIIDVDKYANSQNGLHQDDDVKLENESNQVIEHTKTLQVVLQKTKIYECKKCYLCFTTERDYRLHTVKHAAPIVDTYFSYEKDNRDIKCEDSYLRQAGSSDSKANCFVHPTIRNVCHWGTSFNKDDLVGHEHLVRDFKVDQPETACIEIKVEPEFCINSERVTLQANTKLKRKPILGNNKKAHKSEQTPKATNTVSFPRVKFKTIIVDGKKKYLCLTCNKTISYQSGLKSHTFIHTGEKPYKCDICSKGFNQSGALKVHKNRHEGVTFQCPICKKRIAEKSKLTTHMRVHTGEKPYECDLCGKAFGDGSAYSRHVRTHTGEKPYRCLECPMRFSDASGLIQHKLRHARKKDVQCDICEQKFYTKTQLKLHSTVHAHKYTYECDYCGKCFKRKEYVLRHIVLNGIHAAFNCEFCPRVFYCAINKNIHLRVHETMELDDFECYYCKEKFDNKKSIAKHLKMEHS